MEAPWFSPRKIIKKIIILGRKRESFMTEKTEIEPARKALC